MLVHVAAVCPCSGITLRAVLSKICSTSHLRGIGPTSGEDLVSKNDPQTPGDAILSKNRQFLDFSKLGIFGGHGADLFGNTAPATEKLRNSRFA